MTVKIITKFHQILLCLEVETLLNGQYYVASLTNFKSNVFKCTLPKNVFKFFGKVLKIINNYKTYGQQIRNEHCAPLLGNNLGKENIILYFVWKYITIWRCPYRLLIFNTLVLNYSLIIVFCIIAGSLDATDSILPQIPKSSGTGTIQKYANKKWTH